MAGLARLPFPVLDALPLGAHRLVALTDEGLLAANGVRIAFTGREGGVSEGPFSCLNCASHVGDDPVAVARNRRIVCEATGAHAESLVVPQQIHGCDLAWTHPGEPSPVADGVLCAECQRAVMMVFADCLPLIIVSPTGRFAVVHAGWRGAVAHIAAKAVRELARSDALDPASYNVYIGPHIHAECFEVADDVEAVFLSEFGQAPIASPHHVSLEAAVAIDLESAGIDPNRIARADICTACNPDRFFSYRASGGTCGRHGALAVKL